MLVPVDIFNFLSSAAVSSFISVSVGQILVQMILDQHPIWNNDPMLGLGLHNHPDKLDHSDSEMEELKCKDTLMNVTPAICEIGFMKSTLL